MKKLTKIQAECIVSMVTNYIEDKDIHCDCWNYSIRCEDAEEYAEKLLNDFNNK